MEVVCSEELASMTAEEMASTIIDFVKEAMAALDARLKREHAEACAPLDAELATLTGESAEIEGQSQGVIERMASALRLKQFEYDQLVVAGKSQEAQAKLAELEQIKAAPAKIEARRTEIEKRVAELEGERKTALRRVAVDFREASIELIRGAETGLARLLDGTRDSLNTLETQVGSSLYQPVMLTADEKSSQWFTLNRLYRGRVR